MNRFIDHTLLKPEAKEKQIINLCKEALSYNFASVCVHPHHVKTAVKILKDSSTNICTVVGFPLGANTTASKIFEAQNAIKNGADECDMVMNIGWLKDKSYSKVKNEISKIKSTIGQHVLKVIIEISLLTDDEIAQASKIVSQSNADFIKTSTGFGAHGARLSAVKIINKNKSKSTQIKASGGIRDYKTAKAYIDLGVTRLGTSSGIEIIKGQISNKSN